MERVWLSRLRWRRRGAWMWPMFVVLTLAEGIALRELPPWGDGTDLVPAMLLAGFANLFVVAVLAPLVGRVLRRRRSDLPRVVAKDYAGTTLLVIGAAATLAAGLVHRPAVAEHERDFHAQAVAARAYLLRRAPPDYRAGLASANVVSVGPRLYRTCVPGPDARRAFCVFVHTDRKPPSVVEDPNREPNARFAGPGGYAR